MPRPHNTETKLTILRAATSVFAEQGYSSASISKIAAAASVSKASVFHHFENKENLYLEVLLQTFRLIASAWSKSVEEGATDLNHSLKVLAMDTLDFQQEHSDSLKLLIWEVLGSRGVGEQAVGSNVFHQYFKKIITIIEVLMDKSGPHENVNANEVAFTLLSHTIFYFIFGESLVGMSELPFVTSHQGFSDWLVKGPLLGVGGF